MDNLTFRNSGEQLVAASIENLELKLGISFPEQYRLFLLQTNGGIPNKIYFDVAEQQYVLNDFLSISDSEFSLETYFLDFKKANKSLPHSLIPIAEDAFGNLICISLDKTDYGRIYFWEHEEGGIRLLTNDFDEFLNLLHEDDEE